MNFEREKPVNATVAAQPVTQATAEQVRSAATPRKFAQSKKRYARIQRRDRHKLALRARQLRIAALLKRRQLRAAALRRHMQRPVAATTAPAVVPAYALGNEMRVYRIPVDLPAAPVHDSRWRETILPTANSNRLRRT